MPYIQVKTPIGFTPECTAIFDIDLANIPRSKSVKLCAGTLLKIDPDDYTSEPKSNFNRIRCLLDSNVVARINNPDVVAAKLQLLEDEWLTPSESAVFVRGGVQNGWKFWVVNEDGHQFLGQEIDVFRNSPPENEDQVNNYPTFSEPKPQWQIGLNSNSVFTDVLNENFYNELEVVMTADHRFVSLVGVNAWNSVIWPNSPGVYAVWKIQGNSKKELLYVGLCGKHYSNGEINGGILPARLTRWHPYCFQTAGPFINHFEYEPLANVNQLLRLPYADRYAQHIPASEIIVDCFKLVGLTHRIAPVLLESLILQNHLSLNGSLPPANNQF
jgi:hypothetical protein